MSTKIFGKSNESLEYHLPIKHPLTKGEISEKIGSICAIEIELIAIEIANIISNNLRPNVKNKIENLLMQKKVFITDFLTKKSTEVQKNKNFANKDEKFLNLLDRQRFKLKILPFIKRTLENAFSLPEKFIESEIDFVISDDQPHKILIKIAKEIGFRITLEHLPKDYHVILKIDVEKSKDEAKLAFQILESSQNNIFSIYQFFLDDLKDHFYKSSL